MRPYGGSHRGAAGSVFTGLLLLQQAQRLGLLQRGREGRRLPWATLGIAGAAFFLYFFEPELLRSFPLASALRFDRAALVPRWVWEDPSGHWPRLFLAALRHASDTHLYYNVLSLLWKGVRLEDEWGSRRFGLTALGLTGASHALMVALSALLHRFDATRAWSSYDAHAVGMSALLFALKVIVHADPQLAGSTTVVGGLVQVGTQWAAWAELLLVQLLMPNVSFLGHLSGILAGLAYVSLATPYGDRGRAAGLLQWTPVLLLLAPLRWAQRKLFGAGAGAGAPDARRRFNHAPEGYVLGRANEQRGAPASAHAGQLRRRGPQSLAAAQQAADGEDDDVQIVPPWASAPPLPPGGSISVHAPPPPPSHSVDAPAPHAPAASASSSRGAPYFEAQMAEIYAMGFHDRKANLVALRATQGNVAAAVERLLS